MQPDTNAVKIELNNIIAASPNSISNEETGEGSEDNPVNFSRHSSLWDDDED